MAPGSSQLWLSVNTSDPVQRGAIFGRMLLFTLEKCQHTRSDKYFSLCSEIISPGNLAIATLVDEFFKYQPWAMSDNVSPPKRGGEVGLLGGPERKTREEAREACPHPEEPHFRLLAREEGSFPCVVGKEFPAFP